MEWSPHASDRLEERRLLACLAPSHPVLVTDQHERIVAVNRDWEAMCHYTAAEAFGRTPRLLQGPLTHRDAARDFAMRLRAGGAAFVTLVNYTKGGAPFVHHLYGWALGDLFVAETYAR